MTGKHSPLLLNLCDWQWWFDVSEPEAARLVRVQRALIATGIDPCPETVLGMSRAVLIDGLAPARLRTLADLWDRAPVPPVEADPAWPMEGDVEVMHDHRHVQVGRGGGPPSHRCPQRPGGEIRDRNPFPTRNRRTQDGAGDRPR